MAAMEIDEREHQIRVARRAGLGVAQPALRTEHYEQEIEAKKVGKASQITRVFAVNALVRMLARVTQFSGVHFRHSELLTRAWIEKTVDSHAAVRHLMHYLQTTY